MIVYEARDGDRVWVIRCDDDRRQSVRPGEADRRQQDEDLEQVYLDAYMEAVTE